VEDPQHIVVGADEERGRVGEGLVGEEHPGVDMAMHGDEGQVGDPLEEGPGQGPDRRLGRKQAIGMQTHWMQALQRQPLRRQPLRRQPLRRQLVRRRRVAGHAPCSQTGPAEVSRRILPGVAGEPVEQISAITLVTADMARAVGFYRALGFHLLYGGGDAGFSSFRAGAGYLNLQYEAGRARPVAVWGRAIFWVDDVDAMHDRALAAGLVPLTAPADAPWRERYFHIQDPDGHELSFARPV
jgi:catechol 2,3-dioxygenase-like lactoylglutathione lyase family enzyme